MKMTLHIDEALLKKVMRIAGFTNKTKAVDLALREMARKGDLKAILAKGFGMSSEEIKAGVDPNYDVIAMRVGESKGHYGTKPRSRR